MKTVTYMLFVLAFSLVGCSSQKKMVENPPFDLGEATCQAWKGGRAETGSGLLLEIPVMGDASDQVKLQQAYFRGKITDVKMEAIEGGWVAKANFMDGNAEKKDMVMHADSKQEVGNQPPNRDGKFPFELEQDQCVLSYMEGDSVKYFKLEGIKEKQALIYK